MKAAPRAASVAPGRSEPYGERRGNSRSAGRGARGGFTVESVTALLIDVAARRTGYPAASITAQIPPARRPEPRLHQGGRGGRRSPARARRRRRARCDTIRQLGDKRHRGSIFTRWRRRRPPSNRRANSDSPTKSMRCAPPPRVRAMRTGWRRTNRSCRATRRGRETSWCAPFRATVKLWRRPPLSRRAPARRVLTDFSFLVFFDAQDRDPAGALCAEIVARGGLAELAAFDAHTRAKLQADGKFTHQLAFLLRVAGEGAPIERVAAMISRGVSLAQVAPRVGQKPATVACVQFGGGSFGSDAPGAVPEAGNALAFARTLHLERRDLHVRVLDFAKSIAPATVAGLVLDELMLDSSATAEGSFAAVGFDEALTRRVPVADLCEPATWRPRAVVWSDKDVILVTGGAKGIMAECALGVARETGATLALIGRGESGTGTSTGSGAAAGAAVGTGTGAARWQRRQRNRSHARTLPRGTTATSLLLVRHRRPRFPGSRDPKNRSRSGPDHRRHPRCIDPSAFAH